MNGRCKLELCPVGVKVQLLNWFRGLQEGDIGTSWHTYIIGIGTQIKTKDAGYRTTETSVQHFP